MVDDLTPVFCGVCGSRLVANDTVRGYDVYTGERLFNENLICPNPTIAVTGRFNPKSITVSHGGWSRNTDGTWVQN